MLNQSKLTTQRKQNGNYLYSTCFIIAIIVFSADHIISQLKLGDVYINYVNALFFVFLLTVFTIQISIWLIRNKAYKGMKYAIYHYCIALKIRKSCLDIGYFNKRQTIFNKEIAILPKIKIQFNSGLSKARLSIQNINISKDISSLKPSYVLNKFIVAKKYLSNDENYYEFEMYDGSINFQYEFNSINDLLRFVEQVDDDQLIIDKTTSIPLIGTLIVGQTGSGKTYALYSLILQMLAKKVHHVIYFADPKNSSLAVIGEKVAPKNTATNIEEIVKLLQKFVGFMEKRKVELKEKLGTKLDATYASFNLRPYIFIFDEFASFQSVLQTMEKKKRDEVMKLLSQVVLQGRQLGFFLWIVMQKSDASLLPTSLRENLPAKFVLGNAEPQTYTTAFGPSASIPEKNFALGQGLFTCPKIANTATICHFSYLNFDILEAVDTLKRERGLCNNPRSAKQEKHK